MAEKTEKPTPKRLREARKRGEVVKSKDVGSTLVFIVLVGLLAPAGGYYWRHLSAIANLPQQMLAESAPEERFAWLIEKLFTEFVLLSAPVVGLALAAGVLGGFAQVRALFSTEPIVPKMDRLNPAAGLKRLFSTRNLIDVLLTILKVLLLGVIVYWVVRASIGAAVQGAYLTPLGIQTLGLELLAPIFGWAAVVYCVMAAVDYVHQRYEFMKQMKMSIEELRREHKDMEGDPMIKGKRRGLMRELATSNMLEQVRKASVVVVNPTHIAVALYYETGKTELPVVVAKGEDAMAQRIREIAEQENIPILQNVKLARQLYASTPLDHYIGKDLLQPVAEVLRWVKKLHERRKGDN
jgi:type III secretion protein U